MIAASCRKGHRLNVAGRFESRTFTNNQGTAQTSLEVSVSAFDFVERREESTQATPAPASQPVGQPVGQPQVQYDKAGNGWSLINNQWVMTHPARPAAPPQQFAPTPAPAQQPAFPPFQGQGTCPPSDRPF